MQVVHDELGAQFLELQYSNIEVALVEALPEIRPAAECYWVTEGRPGEDAGPYIFYESMFGAYLEILLALKPATHRDRLLGRAFDFIDRMFTSADPEVRNLAHVAMLEGRDPWWLTRARPFLGPRAVSSLDQCSQGWRKHLDRHWLGIEWPGVKHIIDLYSVRQVIATEVAADGIRPEDVPGAADGSDRNAT